MKGWSVSTQVPLAASATIMLYVPASGFLLAADLVTRSVMDGGVDRLTICAFNPDRRHATRVARSTCSWESRTLRSKSLLCKAKDANEEDEDEEDPPIPDAAEISDADLEELLKGINIGTLSKSPTRSDDLDEMKLIMALRKQMGEADFYEIFNPRNPRIGDL